MEYNIDNFEKIINSFIEKKLIVKRRMKVAGIILENGENIFEEEALNEIVINKGAPSRMIEFTINAAFTYTVTFSIIFSISLFSYIPLYTK